MTEIDLTEFESKLLLRRVRVEDHPALVDLEKRCFPGQQPWSEEQIRSQIEHFPEGQLCLEYDGQIVASSSSLIVDFGDYDDWHSWKEIADGGFIRNHEPEGDTLYGIEIMVDPEFRGYRLSRRLYDARKQVARERNLRRIIIGGRIPGYSAHAAELSASDYVDQVIARKLYDAVLTAQLANGFALQGLIPDYLPGDHESCGYATYLEWRNLDYRPDPGRKLRSVWNQRISLVQYMMRRVESFEEFARQCTFYVDTAGDYHSDFVLFPELFTTQLLSLVDEKRPGLAARKLCDFTPRYLELFSDLALKYNVNVIAGSQLVEEDDGLYNASFLFRRDGSIDKQYKIHITPNEARWWGVQGGDAINVMETDRGRIAIMICYDIEFPELVRVAVAKGANLIFVPFNTNDRLGYLRVRACAQARAIENQVYVSIAGCAGNLPSVQNADIHYSQCGIFTPSDVGFARDAIAAESTPNIETVLTHDVDVELLQRNRNNGTVRPWTDRRRDLYRVHWLADRENEDGI
ncbi:MAG TPA: GNAT family N-acetyltransferase [Myxococcota bacterium]|nr:GNAT family N-acetyltransferase [Myxococcales bacterium]HPG25759.1 GNAT family N-acetyltransferase [Myxococcota bacterium]